MGSRRPAGLVLSLELGSLKTHKPLKPLAYHITLTLWWGRTDFWPVSTWSEKDIWKLYILYQLCHNSFLMWMINSLFLLSVCTHSNTLSAKTGASQIFIIVFTLTKYREPTCVTCGFDSTQVLWAASRGHCARMKTGAVLAMWRSGKVLHFTFSLVLVLTQTSSLLLQMCFVCLLCCFSSFLLLRLCPLLRLLSTAPSSLIVAVRPNLPPLSPPLCSVSL